MVFSKYSGFLNNTDRHDITEMLLKVTLITITPASIFSDKKKLYVFLYSYANLRHTHLPPLPFVCYLISQFLQTIDFKSNIRCNIKTNPFRKVIAI